MKGGTYLPLKKCKSKDKKSVEHLQGIFTTSHRTKAKGWVFLGGGTTLCGPEEGMWGLRDDCNPHQRILDRHKTLLNMGMALITQNHDVWTGFAGNTVELKVPHLS